MTIQKRIKFAWWGLRPKLLGWRDNVDVDALIAASNARAAPSRKPRPRQSVRPGCPTPRKKAYPSLSAARATRGSGKNKGARMRAYRCPCGEYHLARRDVR